MKNKRLLLFTLAVIVSVNAISLTIINYASDQSGVLSKIEALTHSESDDGCYQNMGRCYIDGSTVSTMTYMCSSEKTAEDCRTYATGCGCDD